MDKAPKRVVWQPKMGKDGLFEEPKQATDDDRAKREMQENLNRQEFVAHYHYEDSETPHLGAKTFSPDVSCGHCNHQFDGVIKSGCTFIPIKVHLKAGSCKHYVDPNAGVREIDLSQIGHTAEEAAYGVSKAAIEALAAGKSCEGLVFTCVNCPFAKKAHEADSVGRNLYCGKGDFRVFKEACCELNGQEVVAEYEGNDPVPKGAYEKWNSDPAQKKTAPDAKPPRAKQSATSRKAEMVPLSTLSGIQRRK